MLVDSHQDPIENEVPQQAAKPTAGPATGGGPDSAQRAGATPEDGRQDSPTSDGGVQTDPSAEGEQESEVIVITGMSGAGRTEAVHTFEDLGYFCIDNLPPSLLINLVSLAGLQSGSLRKLAVVCDTRTKEFFPMLIGELKRLDSMGVSHALLFLDASDEALIRRYSESRRRHPLARGGMTILDGIHLERELLAQVKESANYVIDTSAFSPQELRAKIREIYSGGDTFGSINVNVFSFGFKHGAPVDADVIMDVRFLPNPFYEENLRYKTGLDSDVRDFVLGHPETKEFLKRWEALLDVIMPGYVKEGKQHLTIGIGCTGGQHRSIVLADETARYLASKGYHAIASHRDLPLAEVTL